MNNFTTTIGLPLLGLALSASPWILGAAFTHHFTRSKASSDWTAAMSIGIGGYLGYLTLAGLVWICEKQAVNVLNPGFVFTLAAIAWLYTLFSAASINAGPFSRTIVVVGHETSTLPSVQTMNRSWSLGVPLIATIFFYSAFHHSLLPLHAWDALDLWGPQAAEIIKLQNDEQVFENKYYHPQTLSIILAWSSYSSALVSTPTGQAPWFLCTLSTALIVFGYSRRCEQTRCISALIAYMAATVPLLEHHSFLAGYGASFVSVALLGACTLIDAAIEKNHTVLGVLGCLLALSTVALKNVGPFYFFIIFSSYLLIIINKRSKFLTLVSVASVGLLILYFISRGISFQLMLQPFSFSPHEGQIIFAGKLLTIINVELSQVAHIFMTALFLNSSFGIMPLIFVLTAFMSLLLRPLALRQLAFLQLAIALGISGIAASLYTDYGFQNALPGNDTGNSRFMLPIFVLSALLVAPCLREVSAKASKWN